MDLFFCEKIEAGSGVLSPEESFHCLRVLRYVKGDTVNVTDGKGFIFRAVLTNEDLHGCAFEVTGTGSSLKREYFLHIAISPVKNAARFEWFLEKACEIGIDRITPIICERTERTRINTERMRKILISSVKQALIPVLPVLEEAVDFNKFISNASNDPSLLKFIGYCNDSQRIPLSRIYVKGSGSIFLIGPEGDFTAEEVSAARSQGFIPVSLGETRLRTETAGVFAAAAISVLNS